MVSAIQWCRLQDGDLHLWVDNLTVVEHLRDLQPEAAMPDDFEHSDLWNTIAGLLCDSTANIWIHEAKGHDDEALCENPLEDLVREGNDKADHEAVLTNSSRPVFFDRIWKRYIQLAIAPAKVSDTSISEDDQVREEVSHFDFEKFPNSAEVQYQHSWVPCQNETCRLQAFMMPLFASMLYRFFDASFLKINQRLLCGR